GARLTERLEPVALEEPDACAQPRRDPSDGLLRHGGRKARSHRAIGRSVTIKQSSDGPIAALPERRDWLRHAAALTAAWALGPGDRAFAQQPTAAASTSASAAPTGKPNIVFILMDNLGYGELGCYGGGRVCGGRAVWLGRGKRPRCAAPAHRQAGNGRHAANELQCRGAMHAEPLGDHDGP